jgi:N-acetyltransferase
MWEGLAERLEGKLVVLEPLSARHKEGLWDVSQHPEIWTWWPVDPSADEATFHAWFQSAIQAADKGETFHFATLDARTGRPIGSTSFCTLRPDARGVEIGWTWLTLSAWGTGANIEAKLLQLRHAFTRLGCVRVEFETDEQNVRSRRALEALPARFEGVLRDWRILADGRRRSSAYYSILDHEWPEVCANLERRLAAAGRAKRSIESA